MVDTLASVATAVAVVIAVAQLRQAQKQRVREFERRFIERYWHLMDRLPAAVLLGREAADASAEDVFAQYLRLCEDECEMQADLRVSSTTWRVWSDGIRSELQSGAFQDLWEESSPQFTAQFNLLRQFLRTNADPALALPRTTRCWRWLMSPS